MLKFPAGIVRVLLEELGILQIMTDKGGDIKVVIGQIQGVLWN